MKMSRNESANEYQVSHNRIVEVKFVETQSSSTTSQEARHEYQNPGEGAHTVLAMLQAWRQNDLPLSCRIILSILTRVAIYGPDTNAREVSKKESARSPYVSEMRTLEL